MRLPVISQSSESEGSLLLTVVIMQDTLPPPPEVVGAKVTGTICRFGGHSMFGDATKDVMVTGERTVMLAVAVWPSPKLDVIAEVTLFFMPTDVAVTLTEKVQEAPAAKVALAKVTELDPGTAVMAPPPQAPFRLFGVATTKPVGKVSVNATPGIAAPLDEGLVTVKVRVVVAPCASDAEPKVFEKTGGYPTFSVAVPAAPGPALDATKLVVFTYWPGVIEVTVNEVVHVTPAARDGMPTVTVIVGTVSPSEVPMVQPGENVGVNTA